MLDPEKLEAFLSTPHAQVTVRFPTTTPPDKSCCLLVARVWQTLEGGNNSPLFQKEPRKAVEERSERATPPETQAGPWAEGDTPASGCLFLPVGTAVTVVVTRARWEG